MPDRQIPRERIAITLADELEYLEPEYGADLLDWVLAAILIGRPTAQLVAQLHEVANRLPKSTKNTRGDVIEWAAVAAAAVALGRDPEDYASNARSRLEAAFESYGDDGRILEPAIGLAMLAGEDAEADEFRRRRLARPLAAGVEEIGYEVLYLSSRHAADMPLPALADAVTRSSLIAIKGSPATSATGPVLALGRRAENEGEQVGDLLAGRAPKVDLMLFGDVGSEPRLHWNLERVEANCDGSSLLKIAMNVSGEGVLTSGAHALAPITYRLLPTIAEHREATSRAELACIDRVLGDDGGVVAIHLECSDDVELASYEPDGFRGRVAVAWEHALARAEHFAARAELTIVDASAEP